MTTPVIYKIINTINNRFYIGGTQSFESRRKVHKQRLRQNKHHAKGLQEDWNVYGEQAFVFVIVQSVPTVEGLKAAENEWLSSCVGTDICYNVGRYADSPWRGVHGPSHPLYSREVPAETREKIRQIMAKKYSDDPLCHPRLGKKHSEEARKKISEKVQAAVARGGAGKYTRSEETLAKLSAAQKGNQNALGVKRSAEEREAIRQRFLGNTNWLGKKHSEESRIKMGKRVELVLPDGSVKEYPTLTMLRAEWGMTSVAANRALKAGTPITKGKFEGMVLRYVYELE